MKHVILDRKKHTFFILLLFLLPSVLAVTARGEENDFPPFGWEKEGDLLPPFSYTEENAGENWDDWEEDWSIAWNDPEGEGSFPSWDPWEEWEEGGQEEPPSWGPEEDPEEGPAFPEEEPEEGSSPASSSSSSSSSSKAPKSSASSKTSQKKTTQKSKEKVESSGEGNSETNQPAVLPRRVTENDIPR